MCGAGEVTVVDAALAILMPTWRSKGGQLCGNVRSAGITASFEAGNYVLKSAEWAIADRDSHSALSRTLRCPAFS
jgi:hypothetical protein